MRAGKAKLRQVPEMEECNTLFPWQNAFKGSGILCNQGFGELSRAARESGAGKNGGFSWKELSFNG